MKLKSLLMLLFFLGLILSLMAKLGQEKRDIITLSYSEIERRVLVDAGHGGYDPGANYRGMIEKDVALELAKKVKEELEEINIEVVMTREDDSLLREDCLFKDLQARARLGKEENVDLLLSLHVNNYPSSLCFGGQVFYHHSSEKSSHLAEAIQEELRKIQPDNTRQIAPCSSLYLLKALEVPSVLIEAGFIKNKVDRERLTSEEGQREIALAIRRGVHLFYNQNLGKWPPPVEASGQKHGFLSPQ